MRGNGRCSLSLASIFQLDFENYGSELSMENRKRVVTGIGNGVSTFLEGEEMDRGVLVK